MKKSDEQWKRILDRKSYRVLRKKRTEFPYLNRFWRHSEKGIYHCKACKSALFSSESKFFSWSGWPSFFEPIHADVILTRKERWSLTGCLEVSCASCGSHQGHVFKDGPNPTGLRYCINSTALKFISQPKHSVP